LLQLVAGCWHARLLPPQPRLGDEVGAGVEGAQSLGWHRLARRQGQANEPACRAPETVAGSFAAGMAGDPHGRSMPAAVASCN